MPEISNNAAIFLATSYQALERAKLFHGDLRFCNSIVCLIFACFYIEETIDVIIELLNKTEEMKKFTNIKHHPGMFAKFAWFYNFYISENPEQNYSELFNGDFETILTELNKEFPHFIDLYKFRNKVSHGKIDKISQELKNVEIFRQSTKDIVGKMIRIINLEHKRNITYYNAIELFMKYYPEGQ